MSRDTDQITLTVEVFSPRWGHTDPYSITLTSSKLSIHTHMRSAECSRDEDRKYIWEGYNDQMGNPLMQIFSNDSIYAPEIVPRALEWAIDQWRDKSMTREQVVDGLREMFEWIDQTARGKPSGALWEPFF